MPTTGEKISSWVEEMAGLSSKFSRGFEVWYGYEPDANELMLTSLAESDARRALSAMGAPGDLLKFYERVLRISWPDVGNGFFVNSAEEVVAGRGDWQPAEVIGAVTDSVIVFASDGGGGLYALTSTDGKVYRLFGGSLVGATYDVDESGVGLIAVDFWEFLEYLRKQLLLAMTAQIPEC
ncbi:MULTISPECIES: hypothetical protein [unclassified Streptomyces]|uniref:hypothetical protein n=1 Tax=unclassified Streptomyces TaxID=2593676 RepID=UPI00380ED880